MKTSLRGVKELTAFLKDLPRGVKIAAMRAAAEYLLGDKRHGLRHEPAEKFVSRASAYGSVSSDGAPDGYFSWKQFHFVAWITNGFTQKYTRTHELSNAWSVVEKDSNWTTVGLENTADGAEYVYGGSRQTSLVGWRAVLDVISTNIKGAIKEAQRAVDEYIKSKS